MNKQYHQYKAIRNTGQVYFIYVIYEDNIYDAMLGYEFLIDNLWTLLSIQFIKTVTELPEQGFEDNKEFHYLYIEKRQDEN